MKTNETRTKHMQDMISGINEWNNFLEGHPELPNNHKQNIQKRKYLLSAAALLDALRSTNTNEYEIKRTLEEKGVYPYPFMLDVLTRKVNFPNLIMLLLKFRIVFFLLSKTKILKGR